MTYLEKDYLVEPQFSAQAMGSGELAVLATPAIVAFAENTCQKIAQEFLTSQETTVGVFLDVKHLRASTIGGYVKVKARLIERTDTILTYDFEVFENETCLAKGTHRRAIVEIERFMSKLIE